MSKQTFNDEARSERYFTATLLCHLLMTDNFKGLKALFHHIFGSGQCNDLENIFEVVTELDPLRDKAITSSVIRERLGERGRVAVPDIFLRWDRIILIIEAKFFTYPTVEMLREQIWGQKEAIKLVIDETPYTNSEISHALLTVPTLSINDFSDKGIKLITWGELIILLEKALEDVRTYDINYCISSIKTSIDRAARSSTDEPVIKQMSLSKLLSTLPELIADGRIYFGFSEGLKRFNTMTLEELENRAHYKVAAGKDNSVNWHPISLLVSRLVELRREQE